MIELRKLAIVMALLVFPVDLVKAESVSARVGEASLGQAWTFRTHAGCFAALPKHVVEYHGELAEPLLKSRTGRIGQGVSPVLPDETLDLVFVKVIGDLSKPCGSTANLGSDRLEFVLRELRRAQFEYFSRSEFATVPVEILRSTDEIIVIRPVNAADKLKQSMSGGTVLDETGRPLGMVLSVNPKRNVAQALRFDIIKRKAKMLTRSREASSTPGRSAAQNGLTVVSWKGTTVDAAAGPGQALGDGAWLVDGNSAELVLSTGQLVTLTGLALDRGTPSSEQASPVQNLTIYTRKSDSASWILARFCRAEASEEILSCSIAPRKASQIKLSIGAPGAQRLEIKGIRLALKSVSPR